MFLRSLLSNSFNTLRLSIYGFVLLCTVISLSMAAKFAAVLSLGGLANFVPIALVICTLGLMIFLTLLLMSLMKGRNPINTRRELTSLGAIGILYLIFGLVLLFLDAKDADVECFSSPDSTTALDESVAGFRTEQYHAMYRVLNAFILMGAIATLIPTLAMFLWARRKARQGDQHMWYAPITQCAWFEVYSTKTNLPTYEKRAGSRRNRTRSQNTPPTTRYPEKSYQTTQRSRRPPSANSLIDHAQLEKIQDGGMQNLARDRSRKY